MNIAVVVLDTLRKDAFDRHFDWLPGRRFENAYATSNWTAPVHASLFTGRYASEVGVHSKSNELDCPDPTLAETLSEAGYTTRGFSANPNVSKRFDFHRGFETFDGSWQIRHFNDEEIFDWSGFIGETRGEGPTRYLKGVLRCLREDVDTVASLRQGFDLKFRPDRIRGNIADDGAQTALEQIRETEFGDEEFMFVNLMEAHGPYDPPEEYKTVPTPDTPTAVDALLGTAAGDDEQVRQAYDDAVTYLSAVYEEIFAELSASFDYVVTLSDHGEMLGEHGLWDHQYGLYPDLTHVPLVVSGPELSGTVDAPVSLLDVHRTVLELADVDADSRGEDLLSDPGRESLTEFHGLTGWLVDELTDAADSPDVVAEYDREFEGVVLPPSYYGFETGNGWVEDGEADADPEERLAALAGDLEYRHVEASDTELSDGAMDRLKDLGYA